MTQSMTQAQMVAHDTAVAKLMSEAAQVVAAQEQVISRMHHMVRDSKQGYGRSYSWKLSDAAAESRVRQLFAEGDMHDKRSGTCPSDLINEQGRLVAQLALLHARINDLDATYRVSPWPRYIECTNADGHVHTSHGCSTLHHGQYATPLVWRTEFSGLTSAEAVAALGPVLCSVCFPEAPVEHCKSRREVTAPARAAEREAAAVARMAAKAAKTLRRTEQFRNVHGDRVETVAAAKDAIRACAEAEVELEWYRSLDAKAEWAGNEELLTARIRYHETNLSVCKGIAESAAYVLMERERENAGWGATQADIGKIRANKLRSARKEWGLS